MPLFRRDVKKNSGGSEETGNNLIPIQELHTGRRPYGSRGVVPVKGRVRMPEGIFSHVGAASSGSAIDHVTLDEEDEIEEDDAWKTAGVVVDVVAHKEAQREKRAQKKERQWGRWNDEVLPGLLEPYMELARETESLRNIEIVRKRVDCLGCADQRQVEVQCMFFEKIETIILCTCTPLPLQLLRRGLFPCAPVLPTLAVDLQMLDFVRGMFVNAAPNITAWCETLEAFLSTRKFKLRTRDTLRSRFSNALHWYATLLDVKNLQLQDYIHQVRNAMLENEKMESMDVDEDENMSDEPKPLERPSDYLRDRCPLCFGGKAWKQPEQIVDAIVCLDACFTQKRRKAQGRAWQTPREHPETVFVSAEEIADMEREVEEVRPPRAAAQQDNAAPGPEYEPGLRVPTTVLDGCQESFYAADANRVKASTQFFEDTGLMALLCRHDRVIFLANMTSAGEKQHYALCLLNKFFQHVPPEMRIGVLYDIGCQLHRSCVKHGFLSDFQDRIVFGLSVFHAYGHQWPCQLIYHPRKCVGFGFADGEGCERFWSSIKLLIPSLRVSGKYTRIYTLDTQIKHLDEKSMLGLGSWLKRKWEKTEEREAESRKTLDGVVKQGISIVHLRSEWEAQVLEQTKPLKRQSDKLANKEIHEIIALNDTIKSKKESLEEFNQMIIEGEYEEGLSLVEIQGMVKDLESSIEKSQKSVAKKKAKLSIDGRLRLDKLLNNIFLKKRMNALALKQRIRDRLRNRKFELENLERAYRKTTNRLKLDKHAESQIRRKEPGILTLVKKYNKLCVELVKLIKQKKSPRGAVAPREIQEKGIWGLDVDDDIFQDIGLTEDADDNNHIPDWLGNDNVRKGIKALLDVDRCKEEFTRLQSERCAMQEWMLEEWSVLQQAFVWSAEDLNVTYQLSERREYLLRLCVLWMRAVERIPCGLGSSWGPSDAELKEWKEYERSSQTIHNEEDSEGEDITGNKERDQDDEDVISDLDEGLYSYHDIEEGALLDNIEMLALDDEYRFNSQRLY